MPNDLRYAFRLLRRSPGFTLAAVLTLALGIGANTAMYSVLQAVWIDAVPFTDPTRLVFIASAGEFSRNMSVSEEDFADWRIQARVFESLGAVDHGGTVRINGQQFPTAWASPELFETLGARMHLGRPLLRSDGAPEAPPVAVVSHRAWQRTFGGDPTVLGRTLETPIGPVEIVGVAPPGYQLSAFIPGAWVSKKVVPPLPGRTGGRSLQVFGRLAPGVTIKSARAEMDTIAARLATERPGANARYPSATVTAIRDKMAGVGVGDSLWLLLGSTIAVLLIACANIANLFLARVSHRRREMAVRSALGARPGRLVQQMFCESALVAAGGTAAGLLLTLWAMDGIVAALPPNLHRASEVAIDSRVLVFTVTMGAVTAILTGILPALRGSLARPFDLLTGAFQQCGATRARRRLAAGLVVGEVAIAVVVLSMAGLLVTSFVKLRAVDPGFDAAGILTFTVVRDANRTGAEDTDRALHQRILDALATIPQVRGASAAEMLPLSGNRSSYPHSPAAGDGVVVDLDQRMVSPGYFEVMGIEVKEGRTFARSGAPGDVVVVNQRAAQQLWPGRSAIGQPVYSGRNASTVIGVVADVRHVGLDREPVAEIYRPSRTSRGMTYVVRTAGDPAALARTVQSAVEATIPVKLGDVVTLDEMVASSVRVPQFRARLFGLMGLLVGVLALLGVFSVTAYAVAERRREIGIRMALGARPGRTVRLIVAQASLPAAIGIFVGLTVAFSTNQLVAHFLFATSPTDPVTVIGVVAGVFTTVLLAAYVPARRAQLVDPTIALRSE